VVEARLVITHQNNGSAQLIVATRDSNLASQATIDEAYDSATDAAGKANDKKAQGKLREQRKRHLNDVLKYRTNKNTVSIVASANTQGTCGDRKGGDIEAHAQIRMRYLGSDNPREVAAALKSQFGLCRSIRDCY
jgi:hypothetical protein